MMTCRRVIKVGGSCLSQPQLPQNLQHFLSAFTDSQNLLIIGGGLCIDAMRALDLRFSLDQSRMHWRCVELLRTSFEVLSELLPELQCVTTVAQFETLLTAPVTAANYLVAVDTFYNASTSSDSQLPVGWATTTDSIAAYLAKLVEADELLLLKSCSVTTDDFLELSRTGVVDGAFPAAVPKNITVKMLNLQWIQ